MKPFRISLGILLLAATSLVAGSARKMTPTPAQVYGRIQFVDALPDFTIQWVDAFPGER